MFGLRSYSFVDRNPTAAFCAIGGVRKRRSERVRRKSQLAMEAKHKVTKESLAEAERLFNKTIEPIRGSLAPTAV